MKTNDRENLRNELNSIGKGFCLAKWFELDLDLSRGKNRSCDLVNYHSIPLDDLKSNIELFNNSDYKKIQRKFMLDEIQPKECNLCWDIEKKTKKESPRLKKSFDFFSKENIEIVQKNGHTGDVYPRHLKIIFNQNDNILSLYESPRISQTWKQDIQTNGPYIINSIPYNALDFLDYENTYHDRYKNPYVDLFWNWFSLSYSKLSKLHIHGGDPLMDKNIFRIMEFFVHHPNKDLILEINSHCDPLGDRWKGFIDLLNKASKNLKHINLYCKLDCWGIQAEYINYGLSIERLEKNLRSFLRSCKNRTLIFEINFNVLSYVSFLDLLEKIHELRQKFFNKTRSIMFEIKIINSPKFLNPIVFKELNYNLDSSLNFMKKNLETNGNRYLGFSSEEVESIVHLKNFIEIGKTDNRDLCNFLEFIKEFDKRHSTNFTDVFPEYQNFMK